MRQIYSFLLFFLICQNLFGQGNTLLLGKIEDEKADFAQLQLDRKYLDLSSIEYRTLVNEDGKFGFSTSLSVGQMVSLIYNKNVFNIYLSPLDSIEIRFKKERLTPYFNLEFIGNESAVINNTMVQEYYKKYPKDTLVFNYKNYKRGFFYYEIHEHIDRRMQTLSPIDFLNYIEKERADKLILLEENIGYSKDFYDYMKAEIDYYFYYHYLAYAHIYKGRWRINPIDYLAPLLESKESIFKDEYVHSPNYRRFALAFTYFLSETAADKHENPYLNWYYTAHELLSNITQPLILAQIVDLTLRKENPSLVKEIYEHFLKTNPYIEFDNLVSHSMQKIQSLPVGKLAPNFKLENIAGNDFELKDLKGKVVYLDFWASWCRPCLEKLEGLEQLKQKLSRENIIFVHINIDKNTEIWHKTLAQKKFSGLHLFRDIAHEVEQLYDVYSVPKYFFIDKEGFLSFTPSSTNVLDIEKSLLELLSKTP